MTCSLMCGPLRPGTTVALTRPPRSTAARTVALLRSRTFAGRAWRAPLSRGPGQRVQVVPAGVAIPRRAFADLVELPLTLALRALRMRSVLRIAVAPEPIKA